jgi:hypothetical protein
MPPPEDMQTRRFVARYMISPTPDDREDQRPRSLCPVMSFGGYLGIGEEDLHRCGLFDLIVGAYDDYGTYRCCWQSSAAGRVAQRNLLDE